MTKLVKCNKCSWVHFELSEKDVIENVRSFNDYFNSLTKQEQDYYYGGKPASEDRYKKCFRCGNTHKDFSDATEQDAPNGSTIQPIMSRHEG